MGRAKPIRNFEVQLTLFQSGGQIRPIIRITACPPGLDNVGASLYGNGFGSRDGYMRKLLVQHGQNVPPQTALHCTGLNRVTLFKNLGATVVTGK